MRRKPYTERGISRIPCAHCGKPSTAQWQVCSLGNIYGGVCDDCDVKLNELVLNFMRIKNKKTIIKKYEKSKKESRE